MPYSTPAMVRLAASPSSDGEPSLELTHTAADLTDEQLLDTIAEADALIDSYLVAYYTTPVVLTSEGKAPHPIDFWSRDIALYMATLIHRGTLDFSDQDPVARRRSYVMDSLNAVAAGKMRLSLPNNTSSSAGVGAGHPLNPYVGDMWTPDDFNLRQEATKYRQPTFYGN